MEIVKNGKTDRKYPRKTGIPIKKPPNGSGFIGFVVKSVNDIV